MDQLEAIAPMPYQWCGKFDLEDTISDHIRDAIIKDGMMRLPPISYALNDTTGLPDPYGNYRPNNYLEPVNNLGPGYQRDFTQRVEFGELDARGFRPDYDPLRTPRQISRMEIIPIEDRETQLRQIYTKGFDI